MELRHALASSAVSLTCIANAELAADESTTQGEVETLAEAARVRGDISLASRLVQMPRR